jgi:hypothetical protein
LVLRVAAVDLRSLIGRRARLDLLSRGLAKELVRWRTCDDTLLYLERKELLAALDKGLSGIEAARVVMAKAVRRLRGG